MKKLLLFVILTNLISCYTYVNDELPRIKAIKPKTKIDAISFRITGIEDKNNLKEYNKIIRDNLEKSGIFNTVNVIDENEKLDKASKNHLEINLKRMDVFENNWMYGISIVPFLLPTPIPTIIPAFKKNKLSMLVDYYVDGKLKRYDRFYQSSTTLIGLIPLVMRTKNGDSVDRPDIDIVNNLAENTVFYLNEFNFAESA
ncbi:MAG: hypothetical protein KBF93_11690, partial [Leptospiraceae bacterium]|nr:hypothetical protein [Leptospiraceae bacterium]